MGGIAEWVIGVVESLGYLGLAALMALEDVFPPIPSEVILPLAGFLAGQGRMSLPLAVAASTFGSVAGGVVVYAIGARLGAERVERLADRYGRFLLLGSEDVRRARDFFARHGRAAVFLGRMLPGVRSIIALPAGMTRMPLAQFVLYSGVGALIWNTVLISAGYLIGDQWQSIQPYAETLQWVVLVVAAVAVGAFVTRRLRGRRPAQDPEG